jgi:hypothetical protein
MSPPRLLVFQSLWGMEHLPGEKAGWSLEQRAQAIRDAGFDGAAVEFDQAQEAKEIVAVLEAHDLRWCASCYPSTVEQLEWVVQTVAEIGTENCHHINLQADVRPATVLECIPYVLGWQEVAASVDVPLWFETHRNRMTTDLLFTLQLIDAVPTIDLIADLSHFLVGREFKWPVSEETHALIRRILERTSAFHGRVASREQVQIQLGFAQHQQWVDLFMRWWGEGFRLWRARAVPGDELAFNVELGPPWYAITGPDGREQSDRWEEALMLKEMVRDLWRRIEDEDVV